MNYYSKILFEKQKELFELNKCSGPLVDKMIIDLEKEIKKYQDKVNVEIGKMKKITSIKVNFINLMKSEFNIDVLFLKKLILNYLNEIKFKESNEYTNQDFSLVVNINKYEVSARDNGRCLSVGGSSCDNFCSFKHRFLAKIKESTELYEIIFKFKVCNNNSIIRDDNPYFGDPIYKNVVHSEIINIMIDYLRDKKDFYIGKSFNPRENSKSLLNMKILTFNEQIRKYYNVYFHGDGYNDYVSI
jgi:hypothetical protein